MRRSVEKGLVVQQSQKCGEVSEWSKEHAWKVCIRKRIEGSTCAKQLGRPPAPKREMQSRFESIPLAIPVICEGKEFI